MLENKKSFIISSYGSRETNIWSNFSQRIYSFHQFILFFFLPPEQNVLFIVIKEKEIAQLSNWISVKSEMKAVKITKTAGDGIMH